MEGQGGGAVELTEVPLVAQPSSPRRPRGVKFARQQDLMSKWGWILSLCVVPLLFMAYMLTTQNGTSSIRKQLAGALTSSRGETLEAIEALNATLFRIQEQLQESRRSFKSGQGKLEKDLERLNKELGKLRSTQDAAAKEQRGIKAIVEDVKGKVQEVQSTPSSISDDLFLQPGAMVIAETRAHKDLQYVLENFDANMPLNYDLYIFHPSTKLEYFQQAARNVALHRHVVYMALHNVDDFDGYGEAARWYNNLLRSKEEFWDKIEAEKVLTFQVDSVLCGNSPRSIHEFEHLAYIGCGYDSEAGKGRLYWDDWPFWGNGGVTYHRKSKALECIEKFQVGDGFAEDVYYSRCVSEEMGIGRRAESGTHLSEFCTTLGPFTTLTARTFAAHKMNDPMEIKTGIDLFLDYCPEARPLLVRKVEGT